VFSSQLIIVTGKGGVGKSALASAIALRSARSRPTVLVTLETQGRTHPFLDVRLDYQPVSAAPGLSVCQVAALPAIREYVRRKVPFSGIYDAFLRSRMFRDFAEAAPGFEELMCLGKVYDLATSRDFEQVVFDAPSTGHFKTLMEVPAATLDAVRVGPLNHNARHIEDLLLDPERCSVVLAGLPEEMAVREVLELRTFCAEHRIGVGGVLINQWVAERFLPEEVARLKNFTGGSQALAGALGAAIAEAELAVSQRSALDLLGASVRHLKIPRFIDQTPKALIEHIGGVLDAG